jgi:hypothetical protein
VNESPQIADGRDLDLLLSVPVPGPHRIPGTA